MHPAKNSTNLLRLCPLCTSHVHVHAIDENVTAATIKQTVQVTTSRFQCSLTADGKDDDDDVANDKMQQQKEEEKNSIK